MIYKVPGDFVGLSQVDNIKAEIVVNPLSANPTKWSNTLKRFVCFCRQII